MTTPFDDELPVDRWAIRLDEPPAETVAHASGPDDAAVALPFTFSMDVPSVDFQPRLSRFDEAA